GIRDFHVTGVQTCALPISSGFAIHERSRNVFPLPAGAEISVTRAAPSSRSKSAGRATTPPLAAAEPLAGTDVVMSALCSHAGSRSEERRVGKGWKVRAARG